MKLKMAVIAIVLLAVGAYAKRNPEPVPKFDAVGMACYQYSPKKLTPDPPSAADTYVKEHVKQ